jgi:hypothetical protein
MMTASRAQSTPGWQPTGANRNGTDLVGTGTPGDTEHSGEPSASAAIGVLASSAM